MLIKKPEDIKAAEITSKELYLNRRQFIASAVSAGAALAGIDLLAAPRELHALEKLPNVKKGPAAYHTTEKQNALKDITSYNNFYELGTEKEQPAENAKYLTTKPWSVEIEGEVKKAKTFAIEDIMKLAPL